MLSGINLSSDTMYLQCLLVLIVSYFGVITVMSSGCFTKLQDCRNVILIFSVRESGCFQGDLHIAIFTGVVVLQWSM